jgi:hypothetical protein
MTESVLRALGAIPEQIDRERERVRADLFGAPEPTQASVPPQGQPTAHSKTSTDTERSDPLSVQSDES